MNPRASEPLPVPDHELLRMIGRGSYGEVWLARNIMGTWRAVKVVRRADFDSDRPWDREFAGIRRSEPVSRSHEGMVDILHMGRRDAEGFFYYVMELADSATVSPDEDALAYVPLTLAERIRDGALPAVDCLRLVTTVAGVLAHLHAHGLIHRDVKPSNILYFTEVPKLGDMGLVAEAGSSRSFVGTEGYVPVDGPGTERADIFGMGKTLYEALTGYDRSRFPEVPPEWPQRDDFEQCLEINEIILKACESQADRRYQSAREVLADAALVASGRSVKRMRRMERGLRHMRAAFFLMAGLALLVTAAFLWQQRENELVRAKLAQSTSEHTAAEAQQAARLARWYGLQERVRAARYDLSAGIVTDGLAATREAAADQPTLPLRNDAAFLLGRPDLIELPHGSIPVGAQFVLLNLAQRQCLRLPYRHNTPPEQRPAGPAEILVLDDGRTLPLPEGFVKAHGWPLQFEEGGTVLTDGRQRWPMPGTQPKDERPVPVKVPRASLFPWTLTPPFSTVQTSPDQHWTLGMRHEASGNDTLHPSFNSTAGPVLSERQKGGGAHAVFLEPSHFLATTSWMGVTWVEDLLHHYPVLRIPNGGQLAWSRHQQLFGFVSWENDSAVVYEWRQSQVLHAFPNHSGKTMSSLFSPDSQWLATFNSNGVHWWPLQPLDLRQPAKTDPLSNLRNLDWLAGNPLRCAVLTPQGNTTFAFAGAAAGNRMLIQPQPLPGNPADLPALAQSPLEAAVCSDDGRTTALAGYGPVGVWREGVLWRQFHIAAEGRTGDGVRLDLSPDGKILAIGSYHARKAWIWDLEGREGKPLPLHEESFANGCNVTFSADGRWLCCGGDDEIRVLETTHWSTVARWPRQTHGPGEVKFSRNGQLLVIQLTRDDITLVWPGSWEILLTLKSPAQDRLFALDISPDARWLSAAGAGEQDQWLWDLEAMQRELKAMGLAWPEK